MPGQDGNSHLDDLCMCAVDEPIENGAVFPDGYLCLGSKRREMRPNLVDLELAGTAGFDLLADEPGCRDVGLAHPGVTADESRGLRQASVFDRHAAMVTGGAYSAVIRAAAICAAMEALFSISARLAVTERPAVSSATRARVYGVAAGPWTPAAAASAVA